MSIKIPAVAASLLLAGTIGINASSASAATARISPIVDTGSSAFGTVGISIRHDDDCLIKTQYYMRDASGRRELFRSPVRNVNACRKGYSTFWEDGSVSTSLGGRLVSTSNLYAGRHYIGVNIWTRTMGPADPWVRHTFVRSFWHTPASQMPTAHIAF